MDKMKLFRIWGSILRNALLKAATKTIVLVIRCNDIMTMFSMTYIAYLRAIQALTGSRQPRRFVKGHSDGVFSANAWR